MLELCALQYVYLQYVLHLWLLGISLNIMIEITYYDSIFMVQKSVSGAPVNEYDPENTVYFHSLMNFLLMRDEYC